MAYFREMGTDWVSTIPAMEGKQVFKNWPKDWVGRDENPAKFERCVRDVQRKGGAGNAYAVCHASMNPQQRYTAERLYGYPESEFERAEELGYRNFRGKATHLVKGDPATVLKKHGKRVLVHVDHYGTPFYGWMDASDVVTLSAFKKRFGFPPGAVKRNPESTSAAMYESFHRVPVHELLERVYAAFNRKEIETVLAAMHADVDWPNGWEGGRVLGTAAVREYWRRQFEVLDPKVTPKNFTREPDGRIAVDVRQVIHDKDGKLVGDQMVQHVYEIRDGLIRRMEIRVVDHV